ncbi:MAG: MlaD family protein [Thermoleophilaceae bacterium]
MSVVGRLAAMGALLAATVLAALVLFDAGPGGYEVTARFVNAGQIVRGNPVQAGGTPIGTVEDIAITSDGQADIKLSIDGELAPLRVGTRAKIKQLSQSGIANRYIELSFPPDGDEVIDDGGRIASDKTSTAVDLDQVVNTFDPQTRKALQGLFKGNARQFDGAGAEANETFRYLNPALATSSRLFRS